MSRRIVRRPDCDAHPEIAELWTVRECCGFALNKRGSVGDCHQEHSRVSPRSGTAEVERPTRHRGCCVIENQTWHF